MKLKSRAFCLILALAILFSSVFCNSIFSFADEKTLEYWDGSSDSSLDGKGTEEEPYLISTPAEFNYAIRADKPGKYYKLTTDIYLNDINKIDWSTGEGIDGYEPKEWSPSNNAVGYFDGDGHVVYGLYINKKPTSYSEKNSSSATVGYGLINKAYYNKLTQFDNFGMDYIYIDAPNEVGAFVGQLNGTSSQINFYSCFIGENVKLSGYAASGFIGYGKSNNKINIEDSYCLIPVSNYYAKGGQQGAFLGAVWTPSGSSSSINIKYDFSVGRLYGNNNPKSTNYSYATVQKASGWGTIITEAQMKGADALKNMPNLHTEKFITTESYPQLLVFANATKIRINYHNSATECEDMYVDSDQLISELKLPTRLNYKITGLYYDSGYTELANPSDLACEHSDIYAKWEALDLESEIWNGAEKKPTDDADANGYIDIKYPSELAWVISNNSNNKYELLNNIYLNDITVDTENKSYTNNGEEEPLEWYVKDDKAFSGEINGNGHIVYGLFYEDSIAEGMAAGLIPSVNKAVIKNIGIEDAYIVGDSEYRVGALVGTLHTADEVTIEQCYAGKSVYVSGNQKVGGLTGGGAPTNKSKTVRVTIKNCYSLATVDADKSGALIGNLWSTYNRYMVTGCYTNGRFSEGTQDLGSSNGNYAVQSGGSSFWTNLSPEDMTGAEAKTNMPKLDFENVYMTTVDYPQLRVFFDDVVDFYINSEKPVNVGISNDTKISDLEKPARLGYKFAGFYSDSSFTKKIGDNELVKNYTAVYAKLDQIISGDTVYNTFDQEGATFKKSEQNDKRDYKVDGKFLETRSNLEASTEHGRFSQYDAFVEAGAGVGGSNGLKVIRAHGYEKQYPTAVMLYNFDGSSFKPQPNAYYKISLKYKLSSLKKGKEIKIRLREKVGGKVNVTPYSDVKEYGVINEKRIDTYTVSDAWQETEFKFKANEDPSALFIAITTENKEYWAEELEFYIDDIVIEKITEAEMNKAYSSPNSLNTYDEKGVVFTKLEQSDKRDYPKSDEHFVCSVSSMGIGSEKDCRLAQFDAWVEEGAGINGSNAVKVIRAQGYEKQWPTAVCIYDKNQKKFTPKPNSYYEIKLKYRLANIKSGKKIKFRLRSEVGGKYNVKYENVSEYGVINQKNINNYTISKNTWVEASMKFETSDETAPLFLAITTENNKWWAEELELYIDDVSVKEISKAQHDAPYVSPNSKNTYDEKGIAFTHITQTDKRDYKVPGKFEASMSNMGIGTENGRFSQFDAWVEKNTGVGRSNALKVVRAQGYEKQWPTAVCLYDSNKNEFTPRANSFYLIKLKYKLSSLKKGKQIEIRLRQEVGGKYNVKYDKVVDYGRINSTIVKHTNVSDAWVETTFKFATGDEVAPLFLAITTENNKWWAEELELYIDDISIKEITYNDMGFDEGAKGRVWSGKVAMKYAGGDGTENSPYLIETPEQLAKCVNDSDPEKKYYKVIADLRLNNTSSANWTKKAKEWIYDTQSEKFFRGHINGNGHVVSGLYYNSQDGKIKYAALFPQVKGEAVIEKLGIVNSSITINDGQNETYGAAFIAFVPSCKVKGVGTGPKLSQCFADDTVNVDAYFAGGLVCGIASYGPTTLENCYFTGKLLGYSRSGTLFGNSWTDNANFSLMKNCYATSPDRDHIISNKGLKSTTYENVYADSKADNPRQVGIEYSILKFMQGESARELMKGFDFKKIWRIVDGGTPVLRVFDSTKYSSRRKTDDVKISFIVNGGSSCKPISGQPRSDLPELPTPTRYGYEFVGWYHFFDLNLPCELKVFPDYNTVLYAKWVPTGFEIDFEDNLDSKYDYNTATVHHKPGTLGYLPKYNRNGMKSMHCLANSETSPVFLLSYENSVEKGKEYEIVLRMKTDSTEALSGKVQLLFSKYPDISSELLDTSSTVEFKDVNSVTWKEYKAKFVAGDEFIFLSTPKNMSLYFDDIQVVPTGKSGKITVNSQKENDNNLMWIIIGACGVLLLGGISAATVMIVKKKRNK